MLRKRLRTILQVLFFTGLGIALVWWMGKNISDDGWKEIQNAVSHARYWVILPVFFTLLLSHYLRAMRWKLLINSLGYRATNFNLFSMVMIGYMSNLAVPRLGEILKCTLLSRYEKIPPEKLVGTIVAERAVDMVCLIIVAFITILLQADVVGSYALALLHLITGSSGEKINLKGLVLFVVGALLAFLILYYTLKKYRQKNWYLKIKTVLKGVYDGLVSIRNVPRKNLFILQSVVIWILYLLSIQIGFYALKETEGLSIAVALSVLCFGSLGMLVPTQGGLGSYQYAVQKTLLLYGIGEALGYAFGWILWIAQMGIVLVTGLICFVLLPIVNRNKVVRG
jgi:uncharacterized protein (TIRG00374 family)